MNLDAYKDTHSISSYRVYKDDTLPCVGPERMTDYPPRKTIKG